MTKTLLTLVASSIIALSCTAQAQKIDTDKDTPVTKEHFAGEDFHGLKVGSRFDVEITKGDKSSVEITVPEFAVEYLEVNRNSGIVEIYINNKLNNLQNGFKMLLANKDWEFTVKITTPEFNELKTSGQTSVNFLSKYDVENLTISCSGQSKVKNAEFNVTKNVKLHTSGQSKIDDAQTTGTHNTTISCSGQSNIELTSQNTEKLSLNTSGQSDISFTATTVGSGVIGSSGQSSIELDTTKTGSINATSSGSSRIKITGKCESLSKRSSGSSKVSLN